MKTLKLGAKGVDATRSAKFRYTPAKGTCRFYVDATGQAGNSQSSVGRNGLVVKWI